MSPQANLPPIKLRVDDLSSLLAGWASAGHGTLAQRLAGAMRKAVGSGLLPGGTLLPSERALAGALATSRSTVTSALDDLRADGLLVSRQGSGTVVRGTGVRALVGTRIGEHFAAWPGIDLASGNPTDPSYLTPIKLDVAALIAGGTGPGLQPLGLPKLREALAEAHTAEGRVTDVDQVHVTAGAHQAIALAVGTLAGPGDALAVEDASYPGIFDIADAVGARVVPVPCDCAGVRPDALDQVLREERPRAIYLQTGAHNPTGRAPSTGRLRAVAEVLDRHEAAVVEDCALAELVYAGRVRPELADLCRRAVVVSVGSFSKVAWAGLRIGWLRAPAPVIDRTMHQRLASDLGPSVPSQLIVMQLLPAIPEVADRRRIELARTVNRAAERLTSEIPDWDVKEPAGGSVLWVKTPASDTGPFVQLARRHGVHIAPGSMATPGRTPGDHVRICVDRPWEVVEVGIQRLGLAWRDLHSVGGPVLG